MRSAHRFIKSIVSILIGWLTEPIVDGWFVNVWQYREFVIRHNTRLFRFFYYRYLQKYGAWIGIEAIVESIPKCPHECFGIFISNSAHIGKNVVIFHQVTIGSISTVGSKHWGAPTVGDNVYIGCGAKILGNIHIGNNSRIGANCVVTRDIPANTCVYMDGLKMVIKDEPLDNQFIYINPSDNENNRLSN